ncbi:hypothetical protein G9F72_002095 [Clostridium estertheticum]|uniref:hypothetical protein n=1 Tax=Clostridium estertheticum TaxID=238834 RepID=UPI0013E91FEE|nr:hypothetical protein [Clostridium estertheticum]MBZ9685145.1 hypothetical protein [Clostridium estertheticum]
MTIHEKKIKKIFKLFIIALCLVLSIFALVAGSSKMWKHSENKVILPSKNTEGKNEEQVVVNSKITKIAFEKNNNVYLYDEINGQIKSIGDNSKSKDLLKLSPDKTKIVFRYYNQEKAIYPPHVIIYNIKTESLTDIVIDNKNVQQIIDLKWIDNVNILVTGHINPSLSGYAVYNIKNKEELISCVGTIRDVTIDKKNILYSSTPHIFPAPKANLFLNGNKIFEASNDKEEIFDGVISKDGKMIAFRSSVANSADPKGEVSAYLNIVKVNNDNKSISNLKKISISSDTTGDLEFDDKNNISIVGNEFIYKLKDDNLIKIENSTPKKLELSDQQLKKFKQVLAKEFPKDSISEITLLEDIDIYDMETF